MVSPKIWELLDIVGCDDVYQFLGVDRSVPLEELQAAAEKKYISIHNQSSRNAVTRAGGELAGLCKSDIFRNARSRAAYDREVDRRDPKRQAAAAEERRQALLGLTAAVGAASDPIVRYSRSISATGVVLIVSGIALARGFDAPSGGSIYRLGTLVFPCGFTAFLYRGSRRDTAVVAAAGLVLVLLGIIAQAIQSSLTAQDVAPPYALLMAALTVLRLVGGLALLSVLLSFVFRQSWHVKIGGVAQPFIEWWLATMATTRNRLVMVGVTGMALALLFALTAGVVLTFLFGSGVGGFVQGVAFAVLYVSGFLAAAGAFWRYFSRG